MTQSGLILRIIPYSDNARIIKCLTRTNGLQAYFLRRSKKRQGHVQTGQYIEFSVNEKPSKLASIKECNPDPTLGNTALPVSAYATWLFTLELLNKSLEEGFNIPGLRQTIDQYFTHLCHGNVSHEPVTPLIVLSHKLGLWDLESAVSIENSALISDLTTLGLTIKTIDTPEQAELFGLALRQFKMHFSISKLDSLELLL